MKIVDSKKCQSSVKIKIKKKPSSNEEFISEVHWNFPNIYFFKFLNDVIVVFIFILESPFHIKNLNLLHGFFCQSYV